MVWRIDIEATSPEVAAEKAREIQQDPNSTATVFEVHEGENVHLVDLTEKV